MATLKRRMRHSPLMTMTVLRVMTMMLSLRRFYYKRVEEELDYHDDAAVEEGMPAQDEGSRPVDEDKDVKR